jgi:aralkylamine N-acetyltransferase
MKSKSVDNFQIKIIKSAPIQELAQIYKEAGWWESSWGENPDFLNYIVKDSAVFAGAFFDKKLIGMGRALSDLASDAYIQDLAVLKKFRRKGIGKKIIQKLVEKLKFENVDWIGIVAQPGTNLFYEKLGFEPLKDHIPLKLKN